MSKLNIPLFPLNTVLFPDGLLSLRLFEPRYLDMVSACMKATSGFGVCLIHEGNEAGTAASIHAFGTLAKITGWEMCDDGLLGITVCGQQRFVVLSQRVQPDQLIVASINMMPDEPEADILALHLPLVDLLRQTLAQAGHPYSEMPKKYDDASWVSCRLTEVLPFTLSYKQELLELTDPSQRMERISLALDLISQQRDQS